jgi:hypothetical protein
MPELTLTRLQCLTPVIGLRILGSDMECGLDEQVGGLKMKLKPGLARTTGISHSVTFTMFYKSLLTVDSFECLPRPLLFSSLYGSNSETHAWHGTFDPQLLDLLWQDSQQ